MGFSQTYSELFDYHDNGIVRFYDDPDQLEKEISPSQDVLEAVKKLPNSRAHQRPFFNR